MSELLLNPAFYSAAEFRRRDEITVGAELGLAGAVVAQPRRIHRQLHEARKRQGAVGRNLVADEGRQRVAMLALGRSGFRQIDGQGWISQLGYAAIAEPQA